MAKLHRFSSNYRTGNEKRNLFVIQSVENFNESHRRSASKEAVFTKHSTMLRASWPSGTFEQF